MKINDNISSPLKMTNLSITNASLNCKPGANYEKFNLNLNKKISEIAMDTFLVEITINISDETESMNVSATCSAEFSVSDELSKDVAQHLIEKNSISIMFPYIRSYISTITTIPNMSPVVIPPINVNKLIEEAEKAE